MTKINKNWEKLFDKYDILSTINNKGEFIITSKQINEFHAARLMTKFDHKKNLPKLFLDNNLSILPITRGSYIIGRFETHTNLSYDCSTSLSIVDIPYSIESVDFTNIYSESIALNSAFITGIINDFTGEEFLLPTINGRMSSSEFSFYISNKDNQDDFLIDVKNSQLEIDGGYEGGESLAIIEAKNTLPEDFLIRQIYYPYRLWDSKVSKKVLPIFMTYSNNIYSLFQFEFIDKMNYNSLILVKEKHYKIGSERITKDDVVNVYKKTILTKEPQLPFPQANSFAKIINLLEMLEVEDRSKDYITHSFNVNERQTDYYTNALIYLGLAEKQFVDEEIVYSLTPIGQKIMISNYKDKYLSIVRTILEKPSFNEVFRLSLIDNQIPEKEIIIRIMKNCNVYNVKSEETFKRRANTVKKWIEWIHSLYIEKD